MLGRGVACSLFLSGYLHGAQYDNSQQFFEAVAFAEKDGTKAALIANNGEWEKRSNSKTSALDFAPMSSMFEKFIAVASSPIKQRWQENRATVANPPSSSKDVVMLESTMLYVGPKKIVPDNDVQKPQKAGKAKRADKAKSNDESKNADVPKSADIAKSDDEPKDVRCKPEVEAQGFSFWGSFIYWQPSQSCMDVGMEAPFSLANNALGTSHKHGKIVEMDADYAPGYKVGIGFSFASTNWDLFSEYTYLNTENSITRHQHAGGFLYSRWIQPDLIADNASTELKAKWELKTQQLNSEFGRRFFVGSQFELKPHFGIGAAWFDQEYDSHISLITPDVLLHGKTHSDSWGVGPRVGLDAAWHIRPYLSLLANVASEILYTRYHLTLNQKAKNDSTIFLTSSNHINAIRPELEMYLGASYTGYFGKKCRWIKLEAGYDFQYWWSQNMIRWYTDSTYIATPAGDLSFQGLRASLRFGF